MASIVFEQVTKKYDNGFIAVKDFNLDIGDEEFIVLVGPSGCGKTTTLRMLAGLESITSGVIRINGEVINQKSPKDRNIAMVFQSYALYPHLSVFDNMAFSLKLQKVPKPEIRQRVTAAATQLGIETLLDRKPKQLSGGQRQRVAVGRAIVRNPAVFLMDEPLSNLDAKLRVQARAELNKLHKKLKTTFIYVTHDQVEAMTMGTRIAVMNGGILQQVDTPQNLYDRPANLFVAGFLGSPAMNFIPAQIMGNGENFVLKTPSWQIPLTPEEGDRYGADGERSVVLGIRPEDFHDPQYPVADIDPLPLQGRVTVVERMGHEAIAYVQLPDGQEIVTRLDPRSSLQPNTHRELVLNRQRFHLFDGDQGHLL